MKEKQIEEMAVTLCHPRNIIKSVLNRKCSNCFHEKCDILEICKDLYNAGYRKQSDDKDTNVPTKWIWTENGDEDYEQYWICSLCGEKSYIEYNFCPNCGAKMKGGEG
jgi:hypothetical protein